MNLAEIRQNLRDYNLQLEKFRFAEFLGINPEKSLEEIEEIFSDLYTFSTVESLKNIAEDSAEQYETEKIARQRLSEISQKGFLEKQTKEITEEIGKCRRSVRVKFQNDVFTGREIIAKIGIEEKSEIRSELFRRFLEAENVCADLENEKVLLLHEGAKRLGFENSGKFYEKISGVEILHFSEKAKDFLAFTEEIYFKLLAEINLETKQSDFSDFLFLREKLERKDIYDGNWLAFFYSRLLENFNFSVGKIPQITLKKVSVHQPTQAFSPALPGEVYLCFSIKNGKENYFEFLMNFGTAQKNAWLSVDLLDRFPEFVFAPHSCLENAYGFLFQTLLADETFLQKSFFVRDEKVRMKILKENKFRLLFAARREVLRFMKESEILTDSVPDLETIYRNASENFTNNLGFKFEKEQIVFEISNDNTAQKNVRSLLFAYGLREYFREKYDFEWWNKRASFEELIDFWNTGERYSAEEMASLIGFEMSFELLAESFR